MDDYDPTSPILPVLSWEASTFTGWGMYPAQPGTWLFTRDYAQAYARPHAHRHPVCGHVAECPHPYLDEPCQAYEWVDKLCGTCGYARHQQCATTCPQWVAWRPYTPTPDHTPGCAYLRTPEEWWAARNA